MIGIYKITNLINGKNYIGQSTNISRRWKDHRNIANNDLTNNYPLYRAIRKYGLNNFQFSVLEECSPEELNKKEIYWIDYYNSYKNGYNQTRGGEGNLHPLKLSEKQVLEIYEKLKTSETMEDIAEEYGVSHVTISNINTGKIWVHANVFYPIRQKSQKRKNFCCDCGAEIELQASRCVKCNALFRRIEKPVSREELKNLFGLYHLLKLDRCLELATMP